MIIIFDIDGTLTEVGDRIECLERTPKNWDEFYERCGEDKPYKPFIQLARLFQDATTYEVYYLTGRRESCRETTKKWFLNLGIKVYDNQLIMRPDGDYRSDTVVKPEMLQKHLGDDIFEQVDLVFEDRTSMVNFWRLNGITCAQVAHGDF